MSSGMNIERAAGGFVVRVTSRGREVLLIDDAYGKVTLPKGHLEHGESWESAALREVFEETGIHARILGPLGRVEYPMTRDGRQIRKQVRLFLMEALDDKVSPIHQAEEVTGAYYAPWEDANMRHATNGYANWSWLFVKADYLWTWYTEDLETRLRLQPATPIHEFSARWHDVTSFVDGLVQAVRQELTVIEPSWTHQLSEPDVATSLPIADAVLTHNIVQAIEHTLLKPDASRVAVEHLCAEAVLHNFPLVCLHPQYVGMASALLAGSATRVCTVVGFPLGALTPRQLASQTVYVLEDGAQDVDMVIPIGSMKEDDVWSVYEHVKAVVDSAADVIPHATVKVILETSFLTFDQVVKASFVAFAAGAHMIKTSTGFSDSGARLADVAVMRLIAAQAVTANGQVRRVKASGGIRTRREAEAFLQYGANRLGTSSGITLIRQ